MDEPAERKRAMRSLVRRTRRERAAAERLDVDRRIGEVALALASEVGARVVAAYLSSPDEPGTRSFLEHARGADIRVLLPLPRPDGSLDWVDAAHASERVGTLGVPEPVGVGLGVDALALADLVLVPAAAIDRHGQRLGWGRGYYDRALGGLTSRPAVFAIVHDEEFIASVPTESHDVPVDGVVRPGGLVRFT